MKKLMFALAAALPLIALANTNTVSRAEFDALKREVRALHDVALTMRMFSVNEDILSTQKELMVALQKLKFVVVENELNSAIAQTTSDEQREGLVRVKKNLSGIKAKIDSLGGEISSRKNLLNDESVARRLREARAATTSTTNAPTLFRK